MNELLSVFIPSMFLVFFSERVSVYEYNSLGRKTYVYKEKTFFLIAVIMMSVFVGLRTWYNDTPTYEMAYNMLGEEGSIFDDINWSIGENPGFILVNNILRKSGISARSFFMFYAVITNSIYLWFIRKYTDNLWLSVFFYFTMGCYVFTMAAIKQCVAVAFCLVAVDRAIERRWRSFLLWVFIAVTFHPYAIMYIIVPLLMFSPWTLKTYWMIVGFGIAGFGLQRMLGTIVSITSMMGEEYDASTFVGEGVNVFRLAVVWSPILLSFLVRKELSESRDRTANLIMNLSMLNAAIMFVALFGTANYFARLANYFLIFQTVSLPWILKYFSRKSRQALYTIIVLCYLLYFYYAHAIIQPFDEEFARIKVLQYIDSLLDFIN